MRPHAAHSVLSAALLALCCGASATEALMTERTEQDGDGLMAENLPHDMNRDIHDLRLGGGLIEKPHITERVETPSGGRADYRWIGGNEIGTTFGVSLVGTAHRFRSGGALLAGAGGTVQLYDVTPKSYAAAGGYFPNNRSDLKLSYQTASLDVMLGYGTGPWSTVLGDWHFEVLGVGSGGIAWADTQGFDSSGGASVRRGAGWQYAYGPRLGLYLTERSWVFGVHADYVYSHGEVGIKLPNGDESTVTAETKGMFGGQVELGYRF
jgi:hypothetical protein